MPGTEHFKSRKAYRKYLAYIHIHHILTGAAFGAATYAVWSIIRYLRHISQWQMARNDEVK